MGEPLLKITYLSFCVHQIMIMHSRLSLGSIIIASRSLIPALHRALMCCTCGSDMYLQRSNCSIPSTAPRHCFSSASTRTPRPVASVNAWFWRSTLASIQNSTVRWLPFQASLLPNLRSWSSRRSRRTSRLRGKSRTPLRIPLHCSQPGRRRCHPSGCISLKNIRMSQFG